MYTYMYLHIAKFSQMGQKMKFSQKNFGECHVVPSVAQAMQNFVKIFSVMLSILRNTQKIFLMKNSWKYYIYMYGNSLFTCTLYACYM